MTIPQDEPLGYEDPEEDIDDPEPSPNIADSSTAGVQGANIYLLATSHLPTAAMGT